MCPIYYRPTCGDQEISRVGRGPAYQENCTSWNSHAEESKASKPSQSNRSISKKTKVASGLWILRKNGSQWAGKTSERVSIASIQLKGRTLVLDTFEYRKRTVLNELEKHPKGSLVSIQLSCMKSIYFGIFFFCTVDYDVWCTSITYFNLYSKVNLCKAWLGLAWFVGSITQSFWAI